MSDNYYIKGPAIFVRVSDGLAISTIGAIQITEDAKEVAVPSPYGGPATQIAGGIEHRAVFTPHGILDATRLGALFPFVGALPAAKVFTDQAWDLYSMDGVVRHYYNLAVTVQSTIEMGLDKPSVWGQVTMTMLQAKTGDNAGKIMDESYGNAFPNYQFLALSGLFRGKPKVSWFADRTTGQAAATTTLTSDATNTGDGGLVTVGATVYRMKTTPALAYDVKIGADAATTLANLKKAINASGTPGTEYYAGTLIHPSVTAGAITATTLVLTANLSGAAGNSIATTDTATHLSFTGLTMTGGSDAQAASNAVGYSVAAPADKGWYNLLSSGGVKITPRATLKVEGNSDYGSIGNYTVTDTGVDIEFQPIELSLYAFDQAKPRTVGVPLTKGDVVVTAVSNDAAPVTLTAVASQCSFSGGSSNFSADALRVGPVKLSSTLVQQQGTLLPQLALTLG